MAKHVLSDPFEGKLGIFFIARGRILLSFVIEHEKWYQSHLRWRKGERRDRLRRGHRHAEQMFLEKVWWPLFNQFDNLHPEYEVVDWRRMRFFVDFLWVAGDAKIVLEIGRAS